MPKIERWVAGPLIGILRVQAEDEEEYQQKVSELREATSDY
jgi:hypothetical protein